MNSIEADKMNINQSNHCGNSGKNRKKNEENMAIDRGESILLQKKQLRKELKKRRAAIAPSDHEAFSRKVAEQIIGSEAFAKARIIFSFYPMGTELRIDRLFPTAKKQGKTLVFPVCFSQGRMEAYQPGDYNNMALDSYGIPAPSPERDRLIDPEEIDLCLVPLLGFDKKSYRIGYGGGYYDRFLLRLRDDADIIGVAFSAQEVARIPRESFDMKLPLLVTENGFLSAP